MTAYPQSVVSSLDTYSNVPADQRGWDSYRSPSMDNDPPLRPYVAERHGIYGASGANLTEARELYHQVYHSLGGREGLSPLELGHAAAYRAFRSSTRTRPLHHNIELERENLIGLAIAEASRLNRQLGRDINISASTATSEAAARTACRIFAQTRGAFDGGHVSQSRYTTDPYTDYSDYEDVEMTQRPRPCAVRARSVPRTPHPTFANTATVIPNVESGHNASGIPLNASYFGTLSLGPRYPPTPYPSNNWGTRYPSTPQTNPIYTPTPYTGPGAMVASYPRTAPSSAPLPQVSQVPPYYGSGTTIPAPRQGIDSFSSQPTYMVQPAQASYANFPYGYPAAQPEQTTVIHYPKKHRHRHHHHRHRDR